MMADHHIQTQRIVLAADTLNAASASKWHQRLERLQGTTLLPALERQLDRLCPHGETIVLERVEVVLPIDAVEQLEREVPAAFNAELQLALRRAVAAAPIRTSALRLLIEFLHSGRWDWRAGDARDFGQRLEGETERWEADDWHTFFQALNDNFSMFFGRLTQVQGKFQWLALAELRQLVGNQPTEVISSKGLMQQGKQTWQRLLSLAGYKLPVKHQGLSLPSQANGVQVAPDPMAAPTPVAEFFPPNAGLVILHPYFGYLARETGCITGKTLDHQRLANLLHYAVGGDTPFLEWEHVLTKILLGLTPETPLHPMALTDADRGAVDDLLEGVITHWSILKNTSPDGLRNGFLQRPGKLYATPGGWQLLVESRGHDLLLAHLPWGINLVKSPWMAQMLQVNWS